MTPAAEAGRGSGSPGWDADPRVDAYIDRLPAWQRAICQQVRELAHAADPEVQETIRRSVQPYFVLHGNIAALLAAKDHINVFLYDPTVPDPHGIINLGRDNVAARGIQIYEHDTINAPALLAILRAVIANNRAGGWHRLTRPPALRRAESTSRQARTGRSSTNSTPGPRRASNAPNNAVPAAAPHWQHLPDSAIRTTSHMAAPGWPFTLRDRQGSNPVPAPVMPYTHRASALPPVLDDVHAFVAFRLAVVGYMCRLRRFPELFSQYPSLSSAADRGKGVAC
jgi:hypothetical protein